MSSAGKRCNSWHTFPSRLHTWGNMYASRARHNSNYHEFCLRPRGTRVAHLSISLGAEIVDVSRPQGSEGSEHNV